MELVIASTIKQAEDKKETVKYIKDLKEQIEK